MINLLMIIIPENRSEEILLSIAGLTSKNVKYTAETVFI